MPGAGFKKTGREWNETLATMAETPIKFVKKQMAEKRNADSFVSQLYDREGGVAQASAEEHKLIKWAAASMYSAGADTVRLLPFVLLFHRRHSQRSDDEPCISPWECLPSSFLGCSPIPRSKRKHKKRSIALLARIGCLPLKIV